MSTPPVIPTTPSPGPAASPGPATPTPFSASAPANQAATSWTPLSPDEIATIPVETLREKLTTANNLIASLQSSLNSMRTTAAHWHLQHTLLTLEMRESLSRMEVERDITRAELDVMRNEKRRLRRAKRQLGEENEKLKRGEGLVALGMAAERVLEQEEERRSNEGKRRRSRDSTISVSDREVEMLEAQTPRKRKRGDAGGLGTPVSPWTDKRE